MPGQQGNEVGSDQYSAEIIYTEHGVPHIRASDWGNLGFGQGWACAADHLGAMCDHATKATAQRSRYLGIGAEGEHLLSDIGYEVLGFHDRAEAFLASQSEESLALLEGYAAGTRAWFAQATDTDLPEWCRDQPWVHGLSAEEVAVVMMDIVAMASGRVLSQMIGAAARPGDSPLGDAEIPPAAPRGDADQMAHPGWGSNGWAFGRETTANGRGLVLANPHFPWWGEGRLWECHLTIPEDVDVYGVCLVGAPGVQIGTNRSLAWTHTFSRGHRFTLYSHELHPEDPTRYRFNGKDNGSGSGSGNGPDGWEQMDCRTIEVAYRASDGGLSTATVERFRTRYGPVVNLPMVGWSPAFATSFRDANEANSGFVDQAIANARAATVDEYVATLASFGAMPWATSSVADANGDSTFLDYSVTPNLSPEADAKFRESVLTNPLTAMALTMRVALLDGSDPDYQWVDAPESPWPGTAPTQSLPVLRTGTGVFNSNDPAWLCNLTERIDGTPAMVGLDRRPVSPRTRANGLLVGRRWSSASGEVSTAPGTDRWDVESALAALTGRRSLLADLLLDHVLERCADREDLADEVEVLTEWDRRYQLDSVGAALWREFLASFSEDELREAGRLWGVAFDADRPFDTPANLAQVPEAGTDPIPAALAAATAALRSAGVAIDQPLREIQWVQRGEHRVPIPGGGEVEGIADVMTPFGAMPRADIDPRGRGAEPIPGRNERTGLSVGGYPCTYGVSFVMAAGFDEHGPVGRCLLAYGQSSDERSPHYSDQTRAWADGQLRPIRFHRHDVEAAAVTSMTVTGARH